jgi:hypothetical protein
MRKGMARYTLALGLAISIAVAAGLPAFANSTGNPTPCNNGATRVSTIIMGGDTVTVNLRVNGNGFVPNCSYSYSQWMSTKNGSYISGHYSVRIWVCGTPQGTFGTTTNYNSPTPGYVTPGFGYGSCGEQADDLGLYMVVHGVSYTVCYECAGYERF